MFLFLTACDNNDDNGRTDNLNNKASSNPLINDGVTNAYPHDTTSFTEGLLVHEGLLYESTGSPDDMLQTRSLFGNIDLTTGKINNKVELGMEKYFAQSGDFRFPSPPSPLLTFVHFQHYSLTCPIS